MKQRTLGRSGLQVSVVGLGCNNFAWRIDRAASARVIHKALDVGITLFDTADMYGAFGAHGTFGGSEEFLGDGLGARRKDVVIATKFAGMMDATGLPKGASRRYIMSAVEASLARLKTDWIDLYQLHFPDTQTPIEETLRALDDLIHQGKVRYIGCSNLAAWQMVEAQWTAREGNLNPFIATQNEYSLLVRDVEREVMPVAAAYGMGMLPYFPLASGMLTGKYKRNQAVPEGSRLANPQGYLDRFLDDANQQAAERLAGIAAESGHTLLELAFSWLLAQAPVASVIAGATRPEQVEQNAAAVGWTLTPEELAAVDRITAAS